VFYLFQCTDPFFLKCGRLLGVSLCEAGVHQMVLAMVGSVNPDDICSPAGLDVCPGENLFENVIAERELITCLLI
jgi:hypothetical protein